MYFDLIIVAPLEAAPGLARSAAFIPSPDHQLLFSRPARTAAVGCKTVEGAEASPSSFAFLFQWWRLEAKGWSKKTCAAKGLEASPLGNVVKGMGSQTKRNDELQRENFAVLVFEYDYDFLLRKKSTRLTPALVGQPGYVSCLLISAELMARRTAQQR
jgi:hypothetical protein